MNVLIIPQQIADAVQSLRPLVMRHSVNVRVRTKDGTVYAGVLSEIREFGSGLFLKVVSHPEKDTHDAGVIQVHDIAEFGYSSLASASA